MSYPTSRYAMSLFRRKQRRKPFVLHHYEPRKLPNGTTWLYCRDCGRSAGNGPPTTNRCTDPGYDKISNEIGGTT